MSDKPRGGRKAGKRLLRRVKDYENTVAHGVDTQRKHPTGFKCPGSNKK